MAAPAYLLLEDGARFDGDSVGAPLDRVVRFSAAEPESAAVEGFGREAKSFPSLSTGEVVFNTAMSGYQEAVTDPSYRGQIIAFTYPLIGNYGVAAENMESDSVHARAVIMREGVDREDAAHAEGGWLTWLADCGIPALTGVDTRALVRHIRDKGAMRGGVFPAGLREADAMEHVMAEPPMDGRDLALEVSRRERLVLDPLAGEGSGPRVAAIDTGIKDSIVRNLRERGVRLELHPCTVSAGDLGCVGFDVPLERRADGIAVEASAVLEEQVGGSRHQATLAIAKLRSR